jgi:uncharacterized protein (TIGR00251 family)
MSPPTCSSELPLDATGDGVRVTIRLTPRAGRDRIDGVARLADGNAVVKVAVAAPPADGRANAALLDFLAREWQQRRINLRIVAGHKSRNKIVHIAGDPDSLRHHLGAVLAALPRA